MPPITRYQWLSFPHLLLGHCSTFNDSRPFIVRPFARPLTSFHHLTTLYPRRPCGQEQPLILPSRLPRILTASFPLHLPHRPSSSRAYVCTGFSSPLPSHPSHSHHPVLPFATNLLVVPRCPPPPQPVSTRSPSPPFPFIHRHADYLLTESDTPRKRNMCTTRAPGGRFRTMIPHRWYVYPPLLSFLAFPSIPPL
jgi:hypothetical protein